MLIKKSLLGLALLMLGLFALAGCEWPGGMRSGYPAVDYDPRLTREAATALPLIAALSRYHAEHSAFPAAATDLASYLPSPPRDAQRPGWDYYQGKNGSSYVLYRKLGWDPTLQYRNDGSQGHWVFDPGDGSDEKTIILKP